MVTSPTTPVEGRMTEIEYTTEPAKQQIILDQLHSVVASPHFRNSKRYPALLSYIVEEALAGHADALKERTLGVCVFDRKADYDTNADPVVRVSAGEVRKRLAQYYLSLGRERELRIDVPLGSYLPQFYWPEESLRHVPALSFNPLSPARHARSGVDSSPLPALPPLVTYPPTRGTLFSLRPATMSKSVSAFLLSIAVLGTGLMLNSLRRPALTPGTSLFWGPSLRSAAPTLIVLGVHSFDEQGLDISPNSHLSRPQPEQTLLAAMTQTDMVHLSDVTSYGALIDVLSKYAHAFRTQGAADTSLEQLRDAPFILIGGFNNIWTKRLSQQLRFRFVTLNGKTNVIQDSLHPEVTWTLDTSASAIGNSRDYGVASRFLDSQTDQYVIMAAGIGRCGTEAASDFLVNDIALNTWLKKIPPHAGNNVQVVISTDVIEGKHGPPRIIAYQFW